MSEMIRAAIVRVRRESDQQVVGVGFLVDAGKKTILTCAHVINAAIEDSENQVKPRSLISLDFPFLDSNKRLDARVTHFFPKKRDNTDDIALLEILDDLPAEAKAVQLATAETYSGHEFGVYGFPVGFEDNGQYVEGKLQEKLVNKRIQAVGTSNLGYFVERGFSGSPVYDKELEAVIGVMMQVDVEPEKRVAFISPPDVIAALYPELQYRQVTQSAKSAASPTSPPSDGKWLQRVDIFISSPSDVAEERESILRVIERLNRLSFIRSRYVLNPLLYEKEVPPEAGDHAQMIVDRYMAVEDSYLLICLMWNRMGTPFTHPQTGEEFQSGTEYEFTIGYRANGKKGQPHLLLYRKTTEQTELDEAEKEKVDGFFKRFEGKEATFKGLYKLFSSLGEFENMLFEHIDRILHDSPPDADRPDTLVDPDTRPDIVEEARRVDAAMPRECQVGRSTEVRVMICLPDSEGLKALLPDYTAEGDLIDKRDLQEGNLAVAFPVDKKTNIPKTILVSVQVKSHELRFDEAIQQLQLRPDKDSPLLVFSAIPLKTNPYGRIHVVVQSVTEGGHTITLGTVSLVSEINSQNTALSYLWQVFTTSISSVMLTKQSTNFALTTNPEQRNTRVFDKEESSWWEGGQKVNSDTEFHARGNDRSGVAIELNDVEKELLRRIYVNNSYNLILFVLDASWSMAVSERLQATIRIIQILLYYAEESNNIRVGLITFQKDRALTVLNPTTSISEARKQLADIPVGGKTPLSAGLLLAYETIVMEKRKEDLTKPLMVLLTDGAANVSMKPDITPLEEAYELAGKIQEHNIDSIVVNLEHPAFDQGLAQRIAKKLEAKAYTLSALNAQNILKAIIDHEETTD